MQTKTERVIMISGGFLVLFSALLSPTVSISIVILFFTALAFFKYSEAKKPKNKSL